METKKCSKCKELKLVCEFGIRKDSKSGFRSECKECNKLWRLNNKKYLTEYNRKWKKDNFEHISIYNKKYVKKNKKILSTYQKEWYIKNKDKVNEQRRLRKETNPIFLISCSIRKRTSEYLKKGNILKTNKTFEIIGISPSELYDYLESKFTEGMSWENYGPYGWHIDHKIPLSSARNEEELYKLCHYSNLQPLWWYDNLRKSNQILK
jgi:hypothetical protein